MTTAAEVNEQTRARRQQAAESQTSHVDLEETRRHNEALTAAVNNTIETLDTLATERDAINARVKAALDELEAQGIDRGAIKALLKLEKMSDEERQKHLSHLRFLCTARKYPDFDQIEMFGPMAKVTVEDDGDRVLIKFPASH